MCPARAKPAAFGSPHGYEFTVSEGIVSATRSGTETAEALRTSTKGLDVYKRFGYDKDALWLQFTAPISGGNSGGPLVNLTGEVVGVNTWVDGSAQSVNFAISAREIRDLIPYADQGIQPLSKLPAPKAVAAATGGARTTVATATAARTPAETVRPSPPSCRHSAASTIAVRSSACKNAISRSSSRGLAAS